MLHLDGYTTATLIFLAGAAFLAGLARGFSGFGAALIFIPLASTVVGPQVAAPLLLIIDFVLTAGFMPKAWPLSHKRDVAIIAAGAVIGVPFGTAVLFYSDPITVRWLVIALIAPLLALLMTGWRYKNRPKTWLTVGVGTISGFLSGVAQVGGPPVMMYWLGGAHKGAVVRANIMIYSIASATMALILYFAAGFLVRSLPGLALVVGPAYGLGLYLGSHMFGVASEATFRRVCYALVLVALIIGLPLLDGVLR